MALGKCRECGGQMSTAAVACPSCGAPGTITPAKKTSGCAVVFLVMLLFVLFAASVGSMRGCSSETAPLSAAETLKNAQAAAARGDFESANSLLLQISTLEPESDEAKVASQLRSLMAPQVAAQKAKRETNERQAAQARADAAKAAAAAKEKAEAAGRAKAAGLYAKLRKTSDEVQKADFYYSRKVPTGVANKFHVYIAVTGEHAKNLVFEVFYTADDWLFIQRMTIVVDGEALPTADLGFFKVNRDNDGGSIWEWYSEPIPDKLIPLFKRIATGSRVVVRLVGQNYRHDMVLTTQQKAAIAEVLDAYEAGPAPPPKH